MRKELRMREERPSVAGRKRGDAAFIARFIAEVIHVVADLFCKEQGEKERERET